MSRIVFDMDGTLVGWKDGQLALNRTLVTVAKRLKEKGNTLVLWTFGNRQWWRRVSAQHPVLRQLFQEVYTKDELPGHITRGKRIIYGVEVPVEEPVKDIRIVNGDVLVDNDPAHHEWAKRHGLGAQYILVSTFGEVA